VGVEQNDKHGFARDDALRDPRREAPVGYRHAARPVEDELDDVVRDPVRDDIETPPGSLEPNEIEARSTMARFLLPSAFPARRGELLRATAVTQAPAWVTDALRQLPDALYDNVEEVWERLHGRNDDWRS
jgi:hypothetical protein